MQPFYNEQQQLLASTVREFAENDLAPLADEVDTNEQFPKTQFDALAELGMTGLLIPPELGGAGMGYRDFMVVLEEIGAVCGSTSTVLITHTSLGSETINRFGNEDQRAQFLPDLAAGQKIAAFALSEPQTGSDALGLQTTITEDGESYILNGTKLFITNASVADTFAVFVTADRSAGYRGISCIVVERDTPGFEINEQHGKMGMRGSGTAELVFSDCRVPKSNLLGNIGDGYTIALKILDSSRITVAAQCLGLAKGALDQAVAYAKQREAFGRPIATKQAIQFMLADMDTELDAARLMVYRARIPIRRRPPIRHRIRKSQTLRIRSRKPKRRQSRPDPRRHRILQTNTRRANVQRPTSYPNLRKAHPKSNALVISRALIGDI